MLTAKTIVQIIDEWLGSVDIAEVSKRSYRAKVSLWFRYLTAIHYDVRRPTHQQVLDYKRHLEDAGKSSLTIDSYITAVRPPAELIGMRGRCAVVHWYTAHRYYRYKWNVYVRIREQIMRDAVYSSLVGLLCAIAA